MDFYNSKFGQPRARVRVSVPALDADMAAGGARDRASPTSASLTSARRATAMAVVQGSPRAQGNPVPIQPPARRNTLAKVGSARRLSRMISQHGASAVRAGFQRRQSDCGDRSDDASEPRSPSARAARSAPNPTLVSVAASDPTSGSAMPVMTHNPLSPPVALGSDGNGANTKVSFLASTSDTLVDPPGLVQAEADEGNRDKNVAAVVAAAAAASVDPDPAEVGSMEESKGDSKRADDDLLPLADPDIIEVSASSSSEEDGTGTAKEEEVQQPAGPKEDGSRLKTAGSRQELHSAGSVLAAARFQKAQVDRRRRKMRSTFGGNPWETKRSSKWSAEERLDRAAMFIRCAMTGAPLKIHRTQPRQLCVYNFQRSRGWRSWLWLLILVWTLIILFEPPTTWNLGEAALQGISNASSGNQSSPAATPGLGDEQEQSATASWDVGPQKMSSAESYLYALVAETIILGFFLVDAIMLVYATGPKHFWDLQRARVSDMKTSSNGWHKRRLLLVMVTFLDVCVAWGTQRASFRFGRPFRPLYLIVFSRSAREMGQVLWMTLPDFARVLMVFASAIGLWGLILIHALKPYVANHFESFQNFWEACISLYVLGTTESYPRVIWPGIIQNSPNATESGKHGRPDRAIDGGAFVDLDYSVSFWRAVKTTVLLLSFLLFFLFVINTVTLPILYESFTRNFSIIYKQERIRVRKCLVYAFQILDSDCEGYIREAKMKELLRLLRPTVDADILFASVDVDGDGRVDPLEFFELCTLLERQYILQKKDRNLYRYRRQCRCCVSRKVMFSLYSAKGTLGDWMLDNLSPSEIQNDGSTKSTCKRCCAGGILRCAFWISNGDLDFDATDREDQTTRTCFDWRRKACCGRGRSQQLSPHAKFRFPYMKWLSSFLIAVNSATLALYGLGFDDNLRLIDAGCMVVFCIEASSKIVIITPRALLNSRMYGTMLDIVLLYSSFVLWIVQQASEPAAQATPGLVEVLHAPRVLWLLLQVPTLSKIFGIAGQLFRPLGSILGVMLSMMLVFSIIGMEALQDTGREPMFQNRPDGEGDFDNFGNTVLTVWQLLSGSDWHNIMYAAMWATKSRATALYFVLYHILITYFTVSVVNVLFFRAFQNLEERINEGKRQFITASQNMTNAARKRLGSDAGNNVRYEVRENTEKLLDLLNHVTAEDAENEMEQLMEAMPELMFTTETVSKATIRSGSVSGSMMLQKKVSGQDLAAMIRRSSQAKMVPDSVKSSLQKKNGSSSSSPTSSAAAVHPTSGAKEIRKPSVLRRSQAKAKMQKAYLQITSGNAFSRGAGNRELAGSSRDIGERKSPRVSHSGSSRRLSSGSNRSVNIAIEEVTRSRSRGASARETSDSFVRARSQRLSGQNSPRNSTQRNGTS